MKRVLFALRARGRTLATLTGLALLGFGTTAHWLVVEPLAHEVAALEQLPRSRDELRQRVDASLQRASTPQARLAAFRRHFDGDQTLAQRLARLHELAGKHGLELRRGDYRLSARGDDGLARYRMEVPIEGRYPNIRAYALEALHDMPTMSLEQLQVQRRSIADAQVEAVLVFNLFIAP